MTKHTFFIPLVATSILVSGCSWFSPIGRALNKLDSARSVTLDLTIELFGVEIDQNFKIDGNLIEIEALTSIVLDVDYRNETIDVYSQDWNDNWSMVTVTFEEYEFDVDTDSMSFDIEASWVEQDEENPLKYWVVTERLDEFNAYIALDDLDLEEHNPSIESVVLMITKEEELASFEIIVDTLIGDVSFLFEFSNYNETEVTIPTLVG